MCHNLNTLLVVAVLLSCNWSFAQDAVNKPSGETLQQPKSQVWDTPAESEIKEAKTVPFPFEKQESPVQPQPTLSQPASLQPAPVVKPSKSVVIPETPAVPFVTASDEITPEQIEVTPQSSPFTVPRVGKQESENIAEKAVETANDNPDAKTTEADSVPETAAEPTDRAKGSDGNSLDSDYNYKRMLSQKPEPQLKPRYSRYGNSTHEANDTPLDPCSPPERLLRMFPTYRMVDGRYEYVTRGSLSTSVRSKLSPYFIDGWISQGTTLNFHWPSGENNSPIRYNDVANEYVLNQVYVTLGRQVHKSNKWDWGFRADLLYGSDYLYTSSVGLETHKYETRDDKYNVYDPSNADLHWNSNEGPRRNEAHQASMYGLSMPQLYAELYAPSGTTVRVGHFYSNMGIESPMSPYNFFYSHSYSFMYGMPTTFTGGTVTQQLTRQLRIMGGLTQGWDIWESPNKSIGWLGGLEWYSASRNSRLAFNLSSARQSDRNDYNTTYSLLFSHRLTKQLTYSIEHTLGYEENASVYDITNNVIEERSGRQFSITQYLTWQMSESLGIGLRGEWFRDDGHARILRYPINDNDINVTGNDYFGLSLGLNWRPLSCVAIRPEIRYDWSDVRVNNIGTGASNGIYNNQSKSEQVTFGIDAAVRF